MKKLVKWINWMVLISIFIIGNLPIVGYAEEETDSLSSWAREAVYETITMGLATHRVAKDFQNDITREEFCELVMNLYRNLSGQDILSINVDSFLDTVNEEVLKAYELGIVSGIGESLFAPDKTITREEVSVMLLRTLLVAKPYITVNKDSSVQFSDDILIASWAKEAITFFDSEGIICGVGDNRFDPKGKTTRESALVLVHRVYERYKVQDARTDKIHALQEMIVQEMGKPYQWGGIGPDSYDCSGLVYAIYRRLDITLPRTAEEQSEIGTHVTKSELQYGDLVFFARDGSNINHVGIYIGDGLFVHSPQTGDFVKETTILSGYYSRTYYTARRVIE